MYETLPVSIFSRSDEEKLGLFFVLVSYELGEYLCYRYS